MTELEIEDLERTKRQIDEKYKDLEHTIYPTLKDLQESERYYNRWVIKQEYERSMQTAREMD